MKIIIKETNIKLEEQSKKWIVNKLEKLEKFKDLFKDKLDRKFLLNKEKPQTEVWLEVGKTNFHHQKGNVYRAEVQIHFPKKSIRAVNLDENLESAVIGVKKKLERQIRDYKNLLVSKQKK